MAGVEFLSSGPDEGPDEELVVDPRGPRRPRRGALIAGALALLVAAVVFALVHSGGSSTPRAAPDTGTNPLAPEQPSGANRPSRFGATAPEGARGGRSIGLTTPPVRTIECSSPSGCRIAVSLPPQVIEALHERFPTISGIRSRTVLTDVDVPAETVVSRDVDGTAGPVRVHVGLHLANDHDDPRLGSEVAGRQRVVFATTLRDGLAVVVTVTGPPGRVPATATVAGLAGDSRLVTAT